MPKILMSSRDKYINNLDAGIEVVWRNKKYITGNRRHGWVELYKQGKLTESHEVLNRSWEMRSYYNHDHYLLIQEVEQALARQNQ